MQQTTVQYFNNNNNNFQMTNQGMLGPNNGFNQQGPQGPSQVDPYSNQMINQGIAAGFGDFFFNMRDPAVAKTNVPIKSQSSMHVSVIIVTLIFFAGVGIGVGGMGTLFQETTGPILLIVIPYLIYLIVSICCSSTRGFITNLKKFDDYKETYDKMVKGRGYFSFWIQCYHYRTVRTKNGTRREKVVTHTANQRYDPRESIDESGNITGIQEITKYIFMSYMKRFYFTDSNSEAVFRNAYNSFVSRNTRDQYQNHTQTFNIQFHEPEVGYCMLGSNSHSCAIFYIFTLLGLGLPYVCILERSVSRYEINILKRLTC